MKNSVIKHWCIFCCLILQFSYFNGTALNCEVTINHIKIVVVGGGSGELGAGKMISL